RLDAPRAEADVLDVFVQAGRGLAAAHAAGLVHRDFKPGNVLCGDDGRGRVADFGLAVAAAAVGAEGGAAEQDGGAVASDHVTRAGDVVGTPAYMSPEQHRGEGATALSDQWSFCVSLYEALAGRRPFASHDLLRGDFGAPDLAPLPAW